MAESVNLELNLDLAQANRAISSITKSFEALKVVAAAAAAAFAGKKVLGVLEDGVDAAVAQQDAMAQLAQQLKLTGEASDVALKDFALFADQMESTTKYGDDFILNQIAIAKSFGVTNAQAKDLVTAATELSAATGQDLNTSVQALGKTFAGVTGKLDEQIPALKNLTKAQLAAGEAIDIVIKRFGGSAQADLQKFSGALTQTKNGFGNVQEAVGNLLVQNPVAIAGFRAITEALGGLTAYLEENGDSFRGTLNEGIKVVLDSVAAMAPAMSGLVRILGATFDAVTILAGAFLQTVSAIAQLKIGNDIIKVFGSGLIGVVQASVDALGVLQAGISGIAEMVGIKIPEAGVDFASLADRLDELNQRFVDADIPSVLDSATQSMSDFAIAGTEAFGSIANGIDKSGKKLSEFSSNIGNLGNTLSSPLAGGAVGAGGGGGLGPASQPGKEEKSKLPGIAQGVGGALVGGLSQGGSGGASALIGGAASAIAGAFIPGLGGVVGPLVETLSQGPDAVKGLINSLADSFPDVLNAVIDSIPVIIEAIIARLPDIIVALVAAIPRLVSVLASAVFSAITNLLNGFQSKMSSGATKVSDKFKEAGSAVSNFFKDIIGRMVEFDKRIRESLINGVKNAFGKLVEFDKKMREAAATFMKSLVSKVGEFISELVNQIKGKFSGSGGGGFLGQVTRAGKSGGGKVSETFKGFGLVGGETVAAPTADADTGPDTQLVTDLLYQILVELRKPVLATAEATIDNKVLAEIILNLNRRNVRLTA